MSDEDRKRTDDVVAFSKSIGGKWTAAMAKEWFDKERDEDAKAVMAATRDAMNAKVSAAQTGEFVISVCAASGMSRETADRIFNLMMLSMFGPGSRPPTGEADPMEVD